MKPRWRYPLALRLLTGLLLNFLLIVLIFVALPGRAGVGWDLLLTTPVRERLLNVGEQVAQGLATAAPSQWSSVLDAEGRRRGVRLDTREAFGGGSPPWSEGGPPDRGAPPDHGGPPPGGPPMQFDRKVLADMIAVEHAGWRAGFVVRIPMAVQGRPIDLEVQAAGWLALLRFLGIADWILFGLLCLLATALVWAPFAWRLTRAITALTQATRTIAEGRFEVRVPLARRDELGQLAESVNDMAARLERQVESQKQFVADVAHEVTAPLARLRVGLELLPVAADDRAAAVHADLQEDAAQMSALLDELLLFSRTGQAAGREMAQICVLLALVRGAVSQEAAASASAIRVEVPAAIHVKVPAALVQRAIANLVRNALRHGQTGVELHAERLGQSIQLSVRDRGPGVAPESLSRLGEPFYRPDFARARDVGGTGLGLAIVRRCIAAADGTVVFRNRIGGGFEAVITLSAARPERDNVA